MLYHWVVQNEWRTWLILYKLMHHNADAQVAHEEQQDPAER